MNEKKIKLNESGSAHEIYVSWLYYGDIKIRDTFVYKHILLIHAHCQTWPCPSPNSTAPIANLDKTSKDTPKDTPKDTLCTVRKVTVYFRFYLSLQNHNLSYTMQWIRNGFLPSLQSLYARFFYTGSITPTVTKQNGTIL